jgi:hexosaminidase
MDMRIVAAALAGLLAGGSAAPPSSPPQSSAPAASAAVTMPQLVPLPARIELTGGEPFPINASTVVQVASRDAAVSRTARDLTEWIRRCTGLRLTGVPAAAAGGSRIEIGLDPAREDLGAEGYEIAIDPQRLALTARTAAGVFYGAQTIRQLLPYSAEYEAVLFLEPRPLTLPALRIVDMPRYVWRGAMLDVARHFFTVDEVKRFVDLLALHKMNRLHLHLSDDQGWRIAIRKWKDLTLKGGRTEVGGTPGGFYTQAEYKDLIAYAAERFITIVPEIDMPGHTNAAL